MNLILIALAFGLAAVAQALFVKDIHFNVALVLYALAGVLFVWRSGPPTAEPEVEMGDGPLSRLGRWMAAGALVLNLAAWAIFWHDLSSSPGLVLWLMSLALGLATVWPGNREVGKQARRIPTCELALLLLIVAVAFGLRAYGIDAIPYGCQSDEGNNGLDALKWLQGSPYTPYAETNEGQATLFTYVIALYFRLFGVSVPVMRLVSVTAGTLTVLAFYFLARYLFGPRIGLAGAALLASSRWHITFSRIVYEAILVPLCEILLFYFLWRALREGRRRYWALAGLSLTLGLNTYTAFRVVPFGLALFIAYWLLTHRSSLKRDLGGLAVFVLSMATSLAPVAVYTIQHPDIVLIRTRHISVLYDIKLAGSLAPLWDNLRKVALMFNYRGDQGSISNLPGAPMLDFAVAILFALGLIYALRYWRRPRCFLLLSWIVAVLPAGILSVAHEAPSARRTVGLIPAICLLACLALAKVWNAWREVWRDRGEWQFALGLGTLCTLVALANANVYFNVQAKDPLVWGAYSPREAAIGQYLSSLPTSYQVYLARPYDHHSAILLIAHDPPYSVLDLSQHLPLRHDVNDPVVYILEPVSQRLRSLFECFYPSGLWQEHRDPYGDLLFISFTLNPEDVAEVRGLDGRYYANEAWRGQPALQRRDRTISFDWSAGLPLVPPFSVEWQGSLLVPRWGQYTLGLESAGPVTLTIDGQVMASGSEGYVEGNCDLVGGLHRLELKHVEREGSGTLRFTWSGPDGGHQQPVPLSALYAVSLPDNGLTGYYYQGPAWEGSPVIIQRDLLITANELLKPPYSILWRGAIEAPRQGWYLFGTNSDDGSFVYIDGQLVVDNGGSHGTRYAEGKVELTTGYHDLEVRYFQEGGSREMELWWKPPEGVRELVPLTTFFPSQEILPPEQPLLPQEAHPEVVVQAPTPPPAAAKPQEITLGQSEIWGGPGTDNGLFKEPRDIAVDREGNVYVADTGNRRIQKFDSQGEFLLAWDGGEEKFVEPLAVVVTSQGQVFVLDSEPGWIYRFTADGESLGRFAGPKAQFFHPRGMAIDAQDNIYIADTGGCRLVKYDTNGNPLTQFGESGSGPGQLVEPTDVAISPWGDLYVVDTANLRIQRWDLSGRYQAEWAISVASAYNGPHLALATDGSLFVTTPEQHEVRRYSREGELLGQWGGPDQFRIPVGLTLDKAGNLYVTDALNHHIQKFESRRLQ
jgi:4-amino-4-deoxy-L-arabinose transferase-like glycosyltransferase/sugar lactone lactonase YvrE